MKKTIYTWIWKWHFISGMLCLPIILLLAITGILYLFKDNYEQSKLDAMTSVSSSGSALSYQDQWKKVSELWIKRPDAITLNDKKNRATEFTSGMFSHKSRFFLDPYSGLEKGQIINQKTDMHQVRKMHGELLLGSFGTKIIELVACWMIVLLLSGIYLFWPKNKGWRGFFTIRTKASKRILFRDLHAVSGFWFSIILLLLLAGGLPWTDIFGSGYKWVQKNTNSGFPKTWSARNNHSKIKGSPLELDYFVNEAKKMNLVGKVSIQLPKSSDGVFSISNQTNEFPKMRMFHFDQYSGKIIKSHSWKDIGMMMKTRLWIMAFHQGELGSWNFILVLITALGLILLSVSALFSYFKRKPKTSYGIPPSPPNINFGFGLILILGVLGIILPMFGASLILILLFSFLKKQKITLLNRSKPTKIKI